MSEDDDKQFEPSQKRLDDARKRGEIAKSLDLVTAASWGGLLIAMLMTIGASFGDLGTMFMALLENAGRTEIDRPLLGRLLGQIALPTLAWFLVPLLTSALALVAQRAVIFAPTKLAPKADRINPLKNAKQKFGRAGLFEFAKSAAKLMLYGAVLAVVIARGLPNITRAIWMTPAQAVGAMMWLAAQAFAAVILLSAIIGVVDFMWQRAELHRRNRMSRQELMDETKESEGDPQLKQQRRQKAVDIAMNRMLADVPTADVVIVNPTHYAVALKWDKASGHAPICVAKGVDEVAAKIRNLAAEYAVPVRSDPPAARALYATVKVGEPIRPDHYRAVAAAIRFADALKKRAR
ncbi:flagellar type III secretion system protein FlhB [Marivivens aquimaris]|uniref:flagellar type III secretion system protein FlhB n=1 Tax=Marivivens aquimaris TaxID=2774876 RepID=UPI00187FD876|nr:flagellar type III secretion system protein FlhB [Marivivens aquimaris]